MHTNIRIGLQRYTYIHAYVHEFVHKNKPPHHITSTTDKGGNDINSFIQSGYFYSAPLCPLLLGGAPDHSNCMTVSEFTDEALPATVYSRGLQTTGRGPDSARQGLQSGPRCPSRKYKHGPKNSESLWKLPF